MNPKSVVAVALVVVIVITSFTTATIAASAIPGANEMNFTASENPIANNTTETNSSVSSQIPTEKPQNAQVSAALSQTIEDSSQLTAHQEGAIGERTTIVMRVRENHGSEVASRVSQVGTVHTHTDHRVVATLPLVSISTFADNPAVSFIRQPYPKHTYGQITSEGVSVMNATAVHDRGYTGENITVAVVDYSFNTSNPEIADNVVETKNFSAGQSPFDEPEAHGTATAEVIVDTAPNANIIPVATGETPSLTNAIQWIAQNESIDVVSMSVGPLAGLPLDGSSGLSQAIDSTVANGTPFMMSAGNEADGDHWNGTWADPNGNGWMEFEPGDERMYMEGRYPEEYGRVALYFQWNDWPGSNQDYDVYLFNSTNHVVDVSTNHQNGTQPPVELINYDGPPSEEYYIKVKQFDAVGQAEFNSFSIFGDFETPTATQSLIVPATGKNVTAVAAVNANQRSLEPFSSQGPTVDGRMKPELSAPDGVSNSVYNQFFGTSAAAPHAAGTAALLLEAYPQLNPTTIQNALKQTAQPVSGFEPDTKTGHGLIEVNQSLSYINSTRTSSNISLTPRHEGSVEPGDLVTYDVVVENVSGGIGSMTFTASTNNTSVADIRGAKVDIASNDAKNDYSQVTIAEDNSSVTIEASTTESRIIDGSDAKVASVTIKALTPGTTDLKLSTDGVRDLEGIDYIVRNNGSVLTVMTPTVTRNLSLMPAEQRVAIGKNTNYNINISEKIGVGAVELTVTLENGSIATITNASVDVLADNADLITTNTNISENNTTVKISAFTSSAGISNTTNVSLATLSVRGQNNGSTILNLSYSYLQDLEGNEISVESVNDSLVTVYTGPEDVTGDGRAPMDLNVDGRYEDITGDGLVDARDVLALWNNRDTLSPQYFDFAGDGSVDARDVLWLWNHRAA